MVVVLCLLGSGALAEAADVSTVTHGARVQLDSHLAAGKLTLFDFYADWCSGCRQIEPVITRLASANGDALAVRKIDIVNWGSPVAQQFRLRSIPHLKLYDAEGRLLREGDPNAVLGVLRQQLGRGGAPGGSIGLQDLGVDAPGSGGGLATFLVVAVVIIVAGVLVGSMRRRAAEPSETSAAEDRAAARPEPRDLVGGDPDALPIWFAMIQGSLEGPFSIHELEDLERRGGIASDAQVRRKGDSGWRSLDDLLMSR